MKLPTPRADNLLVVLRNCAARRPSRHFDSRIIDGFALAGRFIAGARVRALGNAVQAILADFLANGDSGQVLLALNFMTSNEMVQAGLEGRDDTALDDEACEALRASRARCVFEGAMPWRAACRDEIHLPGGAGFLRAASRHDPEWFLDHVGAAHAGDVARAAATMRFLAGQGDAGAYRRLLEGVAARAAGGDTWWAACRLELERPLPPAEEFDAPDEPDDDTLDESGWFDDSGGQENDDDMFGEPTHYD
jgi:hypothetical protein